MELRGSGALVVRDKFACLHVLTINELARRRVE